MVTDAAQAAISLADQTVRNVAVELLAAHNRQPHFRAALFAVMGDDAHERYFGDEQPREPWVLASPFSTEQQRADWCALAREEAEVLIRTRLDEHITDRTQVEQRLRDALVAAFRVHLKLDTDSLDAANHDSAADRIGEAIVALVAQRPCELAADVDGAFERRLDALGLRHLLCERCRGHVLPLPLRRLVWRLRLGGDSAALERVDNQIAATADALAISDPSRSPIASTVTRLVEANFRASWRKVAVARSNVLRVTLTAERALNELYVFAGAIIPIDRRAVSVAVALAHIFALDSKATEFMLILYNFLTRLAPRVDTRDTASRAMAATCLEALARTDEELAAHLRLISGESLCRSLLDSYLSPLLPLETLLFVWDHCVLCGWESQLPRCLAHILHMLRYQLLITTHLDEVQNVLLRTSGLVRLSDLQAALRQAIDNP